MSGTGVDCWESGAAMIFQSFLFVMNPPYPYLAISVGDTGFNSLEAGVGSEHRYQIHIDTSIFRHLELHLLVCWL